MRKVTMVPIVKEIGIEEYWSIVGIIYPHDGIRRGVREKEFDQEPTMYDIATFLEGNEVDCVSVTHNFRKKVDLTFKKNKGDSR